MGKKYICNVSPAHGQLLEPPTRPIMNGETDPAPLLCCVNKVLLERGRSNLFLYCL